MVLFQFIARSLPSQYKAKFFNIILRLPKDRIHFFFIFNNLKGRFEAVCLTINFFRTYHCSLVGQLHFQISTVSVHGPLDHGCIFSERYIWPFHFCSTWSGVQATEDCADSSYCIEMVSTENKDYKKADQNPLQLLLSGN